MLQQDRRKQDRYAVHSDEMDPVKLASPTQEATLLGEIVNLSLDGMLVGLDDPIAQLKEDDQLVARFSLPKSDHPLVFNAVVVHIYGMIEGRRRYGLRFLPLQDPAANEVRETTLRRYLENVNRADRRTFFRVHLEPQERIHVQLKPENRIEVKLSRSRDRTVLVGMICDISLGGILVRLDDPVIELAEKDQFVASFSLPSSKRLHMSESEVVHVRTIEGSRYYGFRFLPGSDPDKAREKELWRFITEEQRRSLKSRK